MGGLSYPFATMWGPGCIGWIVATFLYGIEVCQFVFYLQAFPCDGIAVKLHVYLVAVLDTAQFCVVTSSLYYLWITCRRSTSSACFYYIPWTVTLSTGLAYFITFAVQIFYAHRVWIISGRNMINTFAVIVFAILQLFFGLMVIIEVIQKPIEEVLFSSKYCPFSSIASAVCDAIITLSVMYYLRPSSIRRQTFIKKLLVVFVEMGMLTLVNALSLVVLYYVQIPGLGQFLGSAAGMTLSKTYVNSMLAVLNARKPIRDQERDQERNWDRSIELPTIRTVR